MARIQQLLQNDNQRDPNAAAPAQPNLVPPGPPPMVLQNPLPHQGMVATQPLAPPDPVAPTVAPPAKVGVHHLMKLSSEVNLHTRCNQYGSPLEIIDP